MVQGFDRREVVQDPMRRNLSDRQQRQEIPGAPVTTPRGADFSRVGEGQRVMGKLLGEASDVYESYYRKKIGQWKVEGQMAYAEGKAESDILKDGNRYTLSGFQSMKARTAFNTWETSAQEAIANGDNTLSSAEYQAKLSKTYKDTVDQVGTDDSDVHELMGALAERSFPSLVAKQVAANNKWREEQTYNSRTGLLISEGDKSDGDETNLHELLTHDAGLNPELVRKSNVEAINFQLGRGNDKLFRAAGLQERAGMKLLDESGAVPKGLTAAVVSVESNGNKNAVGPYVEGQGTAKGEMQVMDATNRDPGYGVVPAKDNSPEERARVGRDYLAAMTKQYPILQVALMAYNAGPGNVDAHIKKVGDPASGKISLDAFIKSFPFKETRDYQAKVMAKYDNPNQKPEVTAANAVNEASSVTALLKAGYTPAEVESISKSYEAYTTKKSQDFDKDRILREQDIADQARKNGNLNQALDQIEATKNTYGYSDSWANSQSTRVLSQIKEYEKERAATLELQNAVNNNAVGTLSGEKRQKAIDTARLGFQGEAQAQGVNVNTPEGQDIIDGKQRDFLIRNNVVDQTWKGAMTSALSVNMVDKDGKPTEKALKAYKDYRNFAATASPGYAAQYLDGDAAKVVALAETYDSGQNSEQALVTAANQLARKNNDSNFTPKTASDKEVSEEINKRMDELDPGFWAFVSPYQAADTFDISEADIKAAKANPALRSAVTAETNRILASDMSGALTPAAAANMAMKNLQGRVELMPGGNVLIGSRYKTVREAAGFPNANANNVMYKATQLFLEEHGKALWGADYHGRTSNADEQAKAYKLAHPNDPDVSGEDERGAYGKVRDYVTGIPPINMWYDPDREMIMMDLLKENDDGEFVPMNNPKPIPADMMGDFMREKQMAERSKASMSEWHKELIREHRKLPKELQGIPTVLAL